MSIIARCRFCTIFESILWQILKALLRNNGWKHPITYPVFVQYFKYYYRLWTGSLAVKCPTKEMRQITGEYLLVDEILTSHLSRIDVW